VAECVRKAWLTLGGLTMPLEDEAAGYYCTQLDLGYPAVREVVNNRPDADGTDDRTTLWGSRLVSANVLTRTPDATSVDDVAAGFAPFMVPRVRPVLHYVLDRPGAMEKTLTVRAANYAWPITGGSKREIQLQWVASDPIARSPIVNEATAWAGTGVLGRVYDFKPPRVYPVGAGLPSAGTIVGHGEVPVQPYLRIFGPISNPRVTFVTSGPPSQFSEVGMKYRVDAGHFVGIDTRAHTARLDDDPGQSVLAELEWPRLVWPVLPNAPDSTTMALSGTGTTSSSQVVASWQDGYLT
jgi:hypothetical protein